MGDLLTPSGRRRKSSAERRASADRRKARNSVLVTGGGIRSDYLTPVGELRDYVESSTRKVYPEHVVRPSKIDLSKI